MNKQEKVREALRKAFPKNPLSYLGWLGFLGVFGVLLAPSVAPFIICFSFFGYRNMIADELFWKNVNRAAARAFWSAFVLNVFVIIVMLCRGVYYTINNVNVQPVFEENTVTIANFSMNQFMIAFYAYLANMLLLLLVFSITMMRFKSQEKKALSEQEE